MKLKSIILIILILLILLVIISGFILKNRVLTQVKELFQLNKTLQEKGYYMAEFEFKMLGISYNLDKGNFAKSLSMINNFHKQLINEEDLIKIPSFKTKDEEIEFYLNLQNPETGAFMDNTYPYCTYWSVTENVLDHLDALCKSVNRPLKLKYPLRFLDEINTPEKLTAYLYDISYVGWIAPKFPQTSFHLARDILSNCRDSTILERNHLYTFSSDWKHSMLKWMYEFQDSTTGMWGPKDRKTKQLVRYDLSNTSSIVKSFRDNNGNDIHKDFPLKYQDKLFKSALNQLSEPMPDENDLDEIHEWKLVQTKGIRFFLRYLWKEASNENKQQSEIIISDFLKVMFEKYYVSNDGAFSYYPGAEHASVDGNSGLIFYDLGAFSYKKQKKLWDDPVGKINDLGKINIAEIKISDYGLIANNSNINSLRIYLVPPDYGSLNENVWAVVYPKVTPILDVIELVPKIIHWADSVSFSIGNWSSKEKIRNEYASFNIKETLVFKDSLSIEEINKRFKETSQLHIVGFDKLQIPRYKIVYMNPFDK